MKNSEFVQKLNDLKEPFAETDGGYICLFGRWSLSKTSHEFMLSSTVRPEVRKVLEAYYMTPPRERVSNNYLLGLRPAILDRLYWRLGGVSSYISLEFPELDAEESTVYSGVVSMKLLDEMSIKYVLKHDGKSENLVEVICSSIIDSIARHALYETYCNGGNE